MKRTFALILALIMLAAAFAGCAAAPAAPAAAKKGLADVPQNAEISPQITLTSSDGESAAEWLTARLGAIPDRVVLGTSADGYGVDVSALEDDGYIIRSLGGEVALFARTAEGLDIAARKYAKAVEAGKAVEDETYHEGYRIGRLTIAGNDISEYAIAVEGEWKYLCDQVKPYAAKGFSDFAFAACGVRVPFGEAEHMIIFRETDDESFEEGTFSYRVEGGDLIFEYAGLLGADYGVYAFFEDECGWSLIAYGDDELAESDHVDVPEGAGKTVTPMFGKFLNIGNAGFSNKYNSGSKSGATKKMYSYSGKTPIAGHGMKTYKWYPAGNEWSQICYTDEAVYAAVFDNVYSFIVDNLDAGKVIGDDFDSVNIGACDNYNYCQCKTCLGVYGKEGGAWSGAVVRWTNRFAEEMEGEGFGGLKYLIFAYAGTNKPCVTKPRADVYVSYCTNGSCMRHPIGGSACQWESFDMAGCWGDDVRLNNKDFAEWARGWGELCDQGNLYVWHYYLTNNVRAYTILDLLWEEMTFYAECGADGLYFETEEYQGYGVNYYLEWTVRYLQLHPGTTKQEYLELVGTIFEREFGDGWQDVYRAVKLWGDAQLAVKACGNCWGYTILSSYDQVDVRTFSEHWDEMLALLDAAIASANSAAQEKAVKRLSLTFLYNGCFSEYFPAYEADDEATLAKLDERWALMIARFAEVGLDHKVISGLKTAPALSLCDTLEETAWTIWASERARFFGPDAELKPAHAGYAG